MGGIGTGFDWPEFLELLFLFFCLAYEGDASATASSTELPRRKARRIALLHIRRVPPNALQHSTKQRARDRAKSQGMCAMVQPRRSDALAGKGSARAAKQRGCETEITATAQDEPSG